MKIVVLGGGISSERHVALVTATSVCKALRRRGHQAVFVDLYLGLEHYGKPLAQAFDEPDGLCGDVAIERTAPDLEAVRRSRKHQGPSRLGPGVPELCAMADCVFVGLHGVDGEDGKVQAMLDLMGVPYTGSGPLASALAMNKGMAKRVLAPAGILTPDWVEVHGGTEALASRLRPPCAVKVIDGGSSLGVELPETEAEYAAALDRVLRYGQHLIIEEKIRGREITVPVLDGRALSPIEIVPPPGGEFDYEAKYQTDGAAEICPCDITEAEDRLLRQAAEKVHHELGLRVYSRADFILDGEGRAWFLEVNTLPGMTPNSLIPKAAAVEGMTYDDLVERIVLLSLENPHP